MRERGSGLLIHISSLLGRMALPFYGPYNASKWALEALAALGQAAGLAGYIDQLRFNHRYSFIAIITLAT